MEIFKLVISIISVVERKKKTDAVKEMIAAIEDQENQVEVKTVKRNTTVKPKKTTTKKSTK